MRRFAAALAACLALAAPARAQWLSEVIRGSGPVDKRYHIVIAAEGYTAAEMGKFHQDAERIAGEFMTKEPYRTWAEAVVITRVDTESRQSGITSEAKDSVRDTYFHTQFYQHADPSGKMVDSHLCFVRDDVGWQRARELNTGNALVILLNDPRNGGAAADGVICQTVSPDSADTLVHELGHVAGLADEYDGPGAPPAEEFPNPNATLQGDKNAVKWNPWVVARPNEIGCWLGVAHVDKAQGKAYRPAERCSMLDCSQSPCAVCMEAMYNKIMAHTPLVDWSSPAAKELTAIQGDVIAFDAQVLQPVATALSQGAGTLEVLWFLDNDRVERRGGGRVSYSLRTADLSPGRHTVHLIVRDHSRFLCPKGWQQYTERHLQWQVDVQRAPGTVPAPQQSQSI